MTDAEQPATDVEHDDDGCTTCRGAATIPPANTEGASWERCPKRHASESQHLLDCGQAEQVWPGMKAPRPLLGVTHAVCPFYACAGYLELVIEQAVPSDDELTLTRVPQHNLVGGYAWFGLCPASLLPYPPSDRDMLRLHTMARHVIRMDADRADIGRAADTMRRHPDRVWETLQDRHPAVDPYWFRWHG